jgi:hypothetical protein
MKKKQDEFFDGPDDGTTPSTAGQLQQLGVFQECADVQYSWLLASLLSPCIDNEHRSCCHTATVVHIHAIVQCASVQLTDAEEQGTAMQGNFAALTVLPAHSAPKLLQSTQACMPVATNLHRSVQQCSCTATLVIFCRTCLSRLCSYHCTAIHPVCAGTHIERWPQ